MKAPQTKAEVQLLRSFRSVCSVLEEENTLLGAGKLHEVGKLLPAKQKEMARLEQALAASKAEATTPDAVTPAAEEEARRFGALVRTNRMLLQGAIDTQNAIIRLVVTEAPQENTCYAPSGHYVTQSGLQDALAIRDDV